MGRGSPTRTPTEAAQPVPPPIPAGLATIDTQAASDQDARAICQAHCVTEVSGGRGLGCSADRGSDDVTVTSHSRGRAAGPGWYYEFRAGAACGAAEAAGPPSPSRHRKRPGAAARRAAAADSDSMMFKFRLRPAGAASGGQLSARQPGHESRVTVPDHRAVAVTVTVTVTQSARAPPARGPVTRRLKSRPRPGFAVCQVPTRTVHWHRTW